VTHRTDLVGDRVRMVNRLRDVLSGYFPALERSFDYAHSRDALVLLTDYQPPDAIRRIGHSRLRASLVERKVRSAEQIAATAVAAAKAQHTSVPGQTSPPASWPTWRSKSWRSALGSPNSRPASPPPSVRTHRRDHRVPAWDGPDPARRAHP